MFYFVWFVLNIIMLKLVFVVYCLGIEGIGDEEIRVLIELDFDLDVILNVG